jgi:hypothetical protein
MLASMKAGFFPFAIGTGISPSQWRPVGDVAFISGQLKMAYNSLVERLEKMTGKSSNSPRFALSNEVQEKVDDAIKNLETAEKEVKERRDELTKYNEMISSGQSKVGPFTPAKVLTPDSIKKSVELYNEAQKNRHRYEMKVFRVISTLGLKLESMA